MTIITRSLLVRVTFTACALCAACVLLLAGCGSAVGTHSSTLPGATMNADGQHAVPTPTLTPPSGWSQVLPQLQFTNTSTHGALVVSAAQPSRVVGCGMPTPNDQPAIPPSFVLSNDGGVTWQIHAIPDMPPAQSCTILADVIEPDSFVVFSDAVYASRDAGKTWQVMHLPRVARLIGLAGGQLFAVADRSSQAAGSLVQASLATGAWRTATQTLPTAGWDPYAAAVDPDNPAVIYLSGMSAGATAVYRTSDGGASWQAVLTLPSAQRIALYTAHHQQVLAEQLNGRDSSHPIYYSADGGANWHDIADGEIHSGFVLGVSPQGRTIVASGLDAWTDTLYAFDPAHAAFTTLGTYRLGQGPLLAAVADGSTPALLAATPDHVWRLPLS